MRTGTVAIVGRSNVGKSTFLNAALDERLAIVSPLPQTTRDALLGVANRPGAQLVFLDTPGLHRPRSELGRRMNAAALDAARGADVLLFVSDARRAGHRTPRAVNASALSPEVADTVHPDDRELLGLLPTSTPTVLVVNKVDLLKDKTALLPLMEAFGALRPFSAMIPTSFLDQRDVGTVLDELVELLPEGEAWYDQSTLTNRPTTYFVGEYVREQVLLSAKREVPHAVAVSIDRVRDESRALVVAATLHVEKVGQRKILVGRGGQSIRDIGIGARKRLQDLLGKKVHLELFVRVTPQWKDVPRQLAELGYQRPEDPSLTRALPDAPRRSGPAKAASRKSKGKAGRGRSAAGKPRTAGDERGGGAGGKRREERDGGAGAKRRDGAAGGKRRDGAAGAKRRDERDGGAGAKRRAGAAGGKQRDERAGVAGGKPRGGKRTKPPKGTVRVGKPRAARGSARRSAKGRR